MLKLLSANLSRLRINHSFWLTVTLMFVIESVLGILLIGQESIRMDILLFMSLQGIGILTSIFLSLFLGTEYSDGTIRNKLIVGHKRNSIYLASLLTSISAITVIYVVWFTVGGAFIVFTQASISNPTGQILLVGFVGWLACVSYSSIFTFIGLLSSNKARTSIFCLLTAFLLLFGGLLCYSLSRPGFFSTTKQMIFQFLFELNPFGQTFQIMSVDSPTLVKLSVYSVTLSLILTGCGLVIFKKKDLK